MSREAPRPVIGDGAGQGDEGRDEGRRGGDAGGVDSRKSQNPAVGFVGHWGGRGRAKWENKKI